MSSVGAAQEVTAPSGHIPQLSSPIPEDPMTDAPVVTGGSAVGVPREPFWDGRHTSSAGPSPSRRPGDDKTFSVHGFQRRLRHYSD